MKWESLLVCYLTDDVFVKIKLISANEKRKTKLIKCKI